MSSCLDTLRNPVIDIILSLCYCIEEKFIFETKHPHKFWELQQRTVN